MKQTIFLNPKNKLIHEVVAYIKSRARASAPNFFDHLLVIVPTAESGRALRLALAQAFPTQAILAPRVCSPLDLIKPADTTISLANETDVQAAFLAFVTNPANNVTRWTTLFQPAFINPPNIQALLGFLTQLTEIWRVLAGGGLLMRDVLNNRDAAQQLACAHGLELQRWTELAEFETEFFNFLSRENLCPYARYAQLACANPAPLNNDITEIILPALVDPVQILFPILESFQRPITLLIHANENEREKFDAWGRPKAGLWNREIFSTLAHTDIFCAPTNESLAHDLAQAFDPTATTTHPALALVDPIVFTDVQAALMDRGLLAHNPERHPLRVSSLGEIIELFISFWECRHLNRPLDWKTFSRIFRVDDLLSFFAKNEAPNFRENLLCELDLFANKFIPSTEPTSHELNFRENHLSFATLATACAKLNENFAIDPSLAKFLRNTLAKIFAKTPNNKEFLAAANATRTQLDAFESKLFASADIATQALLAKTAIHQTFYQLEPDDPHAIKTLGWLELAWIAKPQLALAGFHEGAVPDALIGHAFLPDALRATLALTSNAQRFARDVFLLREILLSRDAHDVKFFVAKANAIGDIQKPSRLLFMCEPHELPTRARHLFDETSVATDEINRAPKHGAWHYNFPLKISRKNPDAFAVSPSKLDVYLKSPFMYFLKYELRLESVTQNDEIPANDFGSLAHKILENFAINHLNAPLAPNEEKIRDELEQLCNEEFLRVYGPSSHWSTNVFLQLLALKKRVCAFAKIQCSWASEGWQIFAAEYKVHADGDVFPFAKHPHISLRGTIDRIDYHPSYGYRLIDYKTWDNADKKRVLSSAEDDLAFAKKMNYPIFVGQNQFAKPKNFAILSIQLPLYARALEAKDPAKFQSRIFDLCYAVLGKAAEKVQVLLSRNNDTEKNPLIKTRETADQIVDQILDSICANQFWPAGPTALTHEFSEFFDANPEWHLSKEWLANNENSNATNEGANS